MEQFLLAEVVVVVCSSLFDEVFESLPGDKFADHLAVVVGVDVNDWVDERVG